MDKLSEQVVCKIVGECTLADIGRVRDALLAVHGDSADNMKLWDVWKAGLKRLEILEKPAKVEAGPVVKERKARRWSRKNTVNSGKVDEIISVVTQMWMSGEAFSFTDIRSLTTSEITPAHWTVARDVLMHTGYTLVKTGVKQNTRWNIKKENK